MLLRTSFFVFIAVFAIAGVATEVHADQRVALVIGNSAYQHTPRLDNPKNDATDMAAVLKQLGFQVIEGLDLDKTAFERKVRDFSVALRTAEVGLFFYAGHGLQVGGQNYLVPVDAKAETADALDWEMVPLNLVQRTMERTERTNIIFVDACRNNPLARNLARAMGTRSADIGRGLAQVESGTGTLISFSTQPGNVASDGAGRNSPFTGALVKRMATSNDDLSALLIEVRNDVIEATQNRQVPWENSSLRGRFYFNPAARPAPSAGPTPQPQQGTQPQSNDAAQAWTVAQQSTDPAVLEAFIKYYGDTFYGAMARSRLAELKRQQVVVAEPPKAPPTQTTTAAATVAPPDWSSVQIRITDLGNKTYMLEGVGGNITVAVGDDGIIIVDTQFSPLSDKIKAAIRTISPLPIKYVINTHFHGDHTGGNANFQKDGAIVVAQENLKVRLAAGTTNGITGNTVPPVAADALPKQTYSSDSIVVQVRGRKAQVSRAPNAHTDGDSWVYFADANVLATGDIMNNNHRYMQVDFANGGHIRGMVAATAAILKIANDKTKVVVGHGPLATRATIAEFNAMLTIASDRVGKLFNEGKSENEVVALRPLKDLDTTWAASEQAAINFLRQVYRSYSRS